MTNLPADCAPGRNFAGLVVATKFKISCFKFNLNLKFFNGQRIPCIIQPERMAFPIL